MGSWVRVPYAPQEGTRYWKKVRFTKTVYSFEPAPDILTPEQKKHILGAQANLWTEYIKTPEHVEYMLLPRLAALSEVQWMQHEKKNYENFCHCLMWRT